MANIPECPPSLKSIQHYLKIASEHDARDIVVAYWCRLHALQVGLKVTDKKTPEETKVLLGIMDWLEQVKKTHKDNEAITNDVAAQAHLENYALKLFLYADKQDREQNYGKQIVKTFYTSGMIYDVLTSFGELTEEASQNRKYAKWKAAYIHNCLKTGETPVPGPMPTDGEQSEESPSDNPPASSSKNNQVPGFSFQHESSEEPGVSGEGNSVLNPSVPTSFNNTFPDPSAALQAASQLPPVPYTPDPNPGGFIPYDSTQQPEIPQPRYENTSSVQLTPEQITKAQKYCKWASSALTYEDTKTAINNLKNALQLLQTGKDPA